MGVPLVRPFGIGDGPGFLLGTGAALVDPGQLSARSSRPVTLVVARRLLDRDRHPLEAGGAGGTAAQSRWGVWILPWALSVDNLTYGLVDGVPDDASVCSLGRRAGAVQRGPGRHRARDRHGLASAFPALRRRLAMSNAIAGVAPTAAAGVLLAVG